MKPLRLEWDKKRIRLKGFRQHSGWKWKEKNMNLRGWNDTWWRHDTKPPEIIEREFNEKNLEGKVERIWISEKNEEMQNSTSEENEELFALQDTRRKDTWTPPTRSWWTLEEWIKSWRTTMKNCVDKKDDEIEWKMKRIRLKPCSDLDGGSDEIAEESELRIRKDENTWT